MESAMSAPKFKRISKGDFVFQIVMLGVAAAASWLYGGGSEMWKPYIEAAAMFCLFDLLWLRLSIIDDRLEVRLARRTSSPETAGEMDPVSETVWLVG
jgi:hypothetical protein